MTRIGGRMLGGVLLLALAVGETRAATLDAYRDKRRPLVVIAPSATDPGLVRQRALLEQAGAALADRDVTVVWVVGETVTAAPGVPPRETAAQLRARYAQGPGFTVVLVGKDGGAKLSSAQPIDPKRLMETIDAMPMRQDDMARARR